MQHLKIDVRLFYIPKFVFLKNEKMEFVGLTKYS